MTAALFALAHTIGAEAEVAAGLRQAADRIEADAKAERAALKMSDHRCDSSWNS